MRILSIHNRYQRAGGEDASQAARAALLRVYGHEVIELVEDNDRIRTLGGARTALRTVWSNEGFQRVRQVLRSSRFDVVDVHNTFPLISPAAYYAAREAGVPVVQTLHNYRLLCASANLYRDGHICTDCVGRTPPWPALVHGCYRGSRAGTAAVVGMLTLHRLLRTWTRMVDVYVAMTEFERSQFVAAGLPAHKIKVLPHFVERDPGIGTHDGSFALFVGRLTPEKGVRTLLAAWAGLAAPVPLKIVGEGPLEAEVAAAAARMSHIQWLGRRSQADVVQVMGEASLLIVPSEWYEPFGLVVIEAYARGTPVLICRSGGLTELVVDGETGLVAPPADAAALANCVAWAHTHPAELRRMGAAARRAFETRFSAEPHYRGLKEVFAQALASAPPGRNRVNAV